MNGKYDDIINLPRHVSTVHPPMSAANRAAQFAPFAALTGYEAAVKETARRTDERIELDEDEKTTLNNRLATAAEERGGKAIIKITYFLPDTKKAGGAYVDVYGTIKKIDEFERIVILDDGKKIPIDEIIGIEGEIFG